MCIIIPNTIHHYILPILFDHNAIPSSESVSFAHSSSTMSMSLGSRSKAKRAEDPSI